MVRLQEEGRDKREEAVHMDSLGWMHLDRDCTSLQLGTELHNLVDSSILGQIELKLFG